MLSIKAQLRLYDVVKKIPPRWGRAKHQGG